MGFLIFKYALTAAIIVLVSEVAKRLDRLGALIGALPMVTVLAMIWLWAEKQEMEKIANHAYYTFWFVIPTLPMFLVIPWMLRKGVGFWPTLGVGVLVTFGCFLLTAWIGKRMGVELLG
jgi:uncharacterized membrane protein (GlpM family)